MLSEGLLSLPPQAFQRGCAPPILALQSQRSIVQATGHRSPLCHAACSAVSQEVRAGMSALCESTTVCDLSSKATRSAHFAGALFLARLGPQPVRQDAAPGLLGRFEHHDTEPSRRWRRSSSGSDAQCTGGSGTCACGVSVT